jgi:8-oxo-dGTP diphosphatase
MSVLPYKIAVLCYVYDGAGNVLLLHRRKLPNAGFYSPIGGKLHIDEGESPHDCALREIREETGLALAHEDVHLCGLVSECAYEGETHWLMFLFEVTRRVAPAAIAAMDFEEGTLEWVPVAKVSELKIPETDRLVMWPLVQQHEGGGFFMVQIDCRKKPITWRVVESRPTAHMQ